MAEVIEITLDDDRKVGNRVFANMVDPINLSILIARVNDIKEKRTIEELVEEFLAGR